MEPEVTTCRARSPSALTPYLDRRDVVVTGGVSRPGVGGPRVGLIESPRILVTSVVSKRCHMLCGNHQNSLQLVVPVHIYVILSMGG